jgi:Mg2+ and Co2+ transporter CorA
VAVFIGFRLGIEMAVSLRDRQRVAELVKAEFCARYNDATREPTDLDVQKAEDSLTKSLRLSKMMTDLDSAQKKVAELKKKLVDSVRQAKPADMVIEGSSRRNRWDNCECTGDYRELLKDIAKHIATKEVRNGQNRFSVSQQERKMLAKVEVAGSTEDLTAVLKAVGLV